MKNKYLITLFFVLTFSFNSFSQQENDNKTVVIQCESFNITRPLRELVKEFPPVEKIVVKKKESDARSIHRRAQKFLFSINDGPEYGNDAKSIQKEMGTVPGRAPLTNWPGQTASGFRPYDPSGAAGLNHYVQMINSTTFKVYNKVSGAVTLTATLGTLWSPATPNDGDPIVMYDKTADRWFLAQFGQTGNKMYIAISTTGDPTGSYYTYTFSSPVFPDYLKFSIWADGYYMTSNQSPQKVFCFERTAMLAGNAASRSIYTTFSPPSGGGFFIPMPGDAADGNLPAYGTPCPIFSYSDNAWGGGNTDAVIIYQMSVNWVPTTPTGTITLAANVPMAAFDASYDPSWNDVSQPGTTQKLDGIGGVCMYRAQWRSWGGYNSILLNWGVKISTTQRSIKWCELHQNQSTGAWSVFQEGIYTPDADTRWMGGIAMDNNGSIGLCYMKSNSTSTYPGLYYTGRRSCDPLGTLPVTETMVIAGTGSQTGGNRVGDYSHLSMDPDGVTFWHTSEYMGGSTGSSAARTQIFSFQVPACGNTAGVYISQTSGTNPQCPGATATFTAVPTNGGTTPAYQWQVNGANVGTNSPTYTTTSLTNGQVITCIMTSNLSGVTGNPATSNSITMSVSPVVTPSVSIALTTGSNPSCSGSTVVFTATPVNGGAPPSYQWKVDGVNTGTNSATFSTNALTNGQTVSCVMTSNASCLSTSTATSNGITMSVITQVTPTVTISQTAGTNPLCAGASATFTATVTNATSPTYQWKVDGTNVGTNSNTYSTTSLTNGQVVSCVVTSTGNCSSVSVNSLGTGTSTNGITSDLGVAYPTYYGNGRQQYLVRASELTALGFSAGSITSLGFNVAGTTGDPATLNGYTIKMAATASTVTTTTFLAPTFTTVFGPVNYTPTLNALNTHNLTTPFAWNGISNVVIDICFSNQVVGNAAYQNYQTTSSFVSTTYYQADGATGAGACTQTTGTTGSVRPNTTFSLVSSNINTTSNTITMTVNASGTPAVSIALTGGTNPSCVGNAVTFTATPTNGGTTPTYQWKVDGVNAGTNSATFTTSSLTNGQVVTCVLTSSSPCVSPSTATSTGITMTINSSVTPVVSIAQTSGSNPQCLGASATFTATPVNGGSTPSYQWQVDGVNAGTNSANFTTTSLTDGQVVTCIMTSGLTCASPATATSNGITMNISASSIVTVTISQTAGTNPICSGESATFTASVVNAVNPIYQWKVDGVNVGTNSNTYTTTSLTNNDVVSCVVTSASGCSSAVSNVLGTGTTTNATNVDLGVAYPTYYGNGRQQYVIRASELVALGFSAGNFTSLGFSNAGTVGNPATMNGYTIKMAMTASTTSTSTFLNPSFTTVFGPSNYTPTLNAINTHNFSTPFVWDGSSNVLVDICFSNQVVGVTAYQNHQTTSSFVSTTYYQADGTGGAAACSQATGTTGSIRPNMTLTLGSTNVNTASNNITMTVNASGSPAISIAITGGANPACVGTSVTFTATPTNGGSSPTYQWLVNGVNAGTNSPTFSTSSITNGQIVSCVMTSNLVCVSPTFATSNDIEMTIYSSVVPSVSIAQTSGTNPICAGVSATFTATPVSGGSTPSYQWKVNGANVGMNSLTYTTTTLTNGQVVTCVMTSSISCASPATATSNGITMSVNSSSAISVSIAQTGGTIPLCSGQSATFTATTVNATSPTYQWKVDGVNVGTNSDTYSSSSLTNGQLITCDVSATPSCPVISVYTLGTGATTNTTTAESGVAYPTRYGNGKQQFLVLASELTALGFTAGDISSLGFTVAGTTGNPATLNGYTIKLATTTVTAMTNTFQSPTPAFTTVFGPVNYTPALNSLNTHTFTSPFTWNGTSNLLVDICFSNGATTGVTAYQTYQTSSAFVSNTYYRSNTNASSCTRTTGTGTASMRPNMRLTMSSVGSGNASSNAITMSVAPIVPASVSISLTGGTNPQCAGASATFTATSVNGGSSPSYQWKNGTTNVGTNSPTYTTTGLNNGNLISCIMTSNASCVTGNPATSNAISMTVNPSDNSIPSVSVFDNCNGTSTLTASGFTGNLTWSDGGTNNPHTVSIGGSYTVYQSIGACQSPPSTPVNATPGAPVSDNNVCTNDVCDPLTGNTLHNAIAIDDNNACTTDACDPVTGPSHTAVNTDDSNVCTTDGCNPSTGIYHTPISVDDNNVCTTDACDPVTGSSHTIINVDDNDACTTDACDPVTGPSHTAVNTDDSNVCTTDGCNPTTGIYHTPINIDDNNVCTTDACDPVTGPSHTVISVDDNDACTTDACDPVTGPSHSQINIDDNNACTLDACDPLTGVYHNQLPCNINLTMKLFIEGFYSSGGLMQNGLNSNNNNAGCLNTDFVGLSSDSTDVDTVRVTLMSPLAPYNPVDSAIGILKTNGTLIVSFGSASPGNYYLKINHRNSIETWSASDILLGSASTYDFSDTLIKAYGNNLQDLGDGNYAIFSGDIADSNNGFGGIIGLQDGIVESADYSDMENAVSVVAAGYVIADITGDGIVESSDYGLIENAVYLIRIVIRP